MSLDFQQVQQQIHQLGEGARAREEDYLRKLEKAEGLLEQYARDPEYLNTRVQKIVRLHEPILRCALPARLNPEPLDHHAPLPVSLPHSAVLAADGSQIPPSRHFEVNYGLINVGAFRMDIDSSQAPAMCVRSRLLYDDMLNSGGGMMTEEALNLERDLAERDLLAELAVEALASAEAPAPLLVTFTDGPIELWGAKDSSDSQGFQRSLERHQAALQRLYELGAIAAGYVDKPAANLLVRLLEVASLPEEALQNVRKIHPLLGVTDRALLESRLAPGERSAVYAMQSRSAAQYQDVLALHFFYLNVGREGHPWLARVEIPAWVAEEPGQLDVLHAVLVNQCQVLGSRPYPYALHRAHEAAVVTFEEGQQVREMIIHELLNRGVQVGSKSNKQVAKDAGGRTRFGGGKP